MSTPSSQTLSKHSDSSPISVSYSSAIFSTNSSYLHRLPMSSSKCVTFSTFNRWDAHYLDRFNIAKLESTETFRPYTSFLRLRERLGSSTAAHVDHCLMQLGFWENRSFAPPAHPWNIDLTFYILICMSDWRAASQESSYYGAFLDLTLSCCTSTV